MKKMWKKPIALLMCLCMVFSVMTISVHADELDYTELDVVDSYIGTQLSQDNYTSDSWAALVSAYDTFNSNYSEDWTQTELDDELATLLNALFALEAADGSTAVDLTELTALIAQVESLWADDDYDEDTGYNLKYTTESQDPVYAAYDAAYANVFLSTGDDSSVTQAMADYYVYYITYYWSLLEEDPDYTSSGSETPDEPDTGETTDYTVSGLVFQALAWNDDGTIDLVEFGTESGIENANVLATLSSSQTTAASNYLGMAQSSDGTTYLSTYGNSGNVYWYTLNDDYSVTLIGQESTASSYNAVDLAIGETSGLLLNSTTTKWYTIGASTEGTWLGEHYSGSVAAVVSTGETESYTSGDVEYTLEYFYVLLRSGKLYKAAYYESINSTTGDHGLTRYSNTSLGTIGDTSIITGGTSDATVKYSMTLYTDGTDDQNGLYFSNGSTLYKISLDDYSVTEIGSAAEGASYYGLTVIGYQEAESEEPSSETYLYGVRYDYSAETFELIMIDPATGEYGVVSEITQPAVSASSSNWGAMGGATADSDGIVWISNRSDTTLYTLDESYAMTEAGDSHSQLDITYSPSMNAVIGAYSRYLYVYDIDTGTVSTCTITSSALTAYLAGVTYMYTNEDGNDVFWAITATSGYTTHTIYEIVLTEDESGAVTVSSSAVLGTLTLNGKARNSVYYWSLAYDETTETLYITGNLTGDESDSLWSVSVDAAAGTFDAEGTMIKSYAQDGGYIFGLYLAAKDSSVEIVVNLYTDDLEAAIAEAEEVDRDNTYTEDSLSALDEALEAAKEALENAETQDEIDAATTALEEALAALVQVAGDEDQSAVDTSKLEKLYEFRRQVYGGEDSTYSEEYSTAIVKTRAYLTDFEGNYSQEKIDALCKELFEATAELSWADVSSDYLSTVEAAQAVVDAADAYTAESQAYIAIIAEILADADSWVGDDATYASSNALKAFYIWLLGDVMDELVAYDWELSSCTWAEDYSTCTFTLVGVSGGTYDGQKKEVTVTAASESTVTSCTEGGTIIYTATYTDTDDQDGHVYTVTEIVEVAAGEHTWDEGVVTKEATCTEDGEMTYTCTVCGEIRTEAIEKTGHTAGEAVTENYVAPTCTEKGSYDVVVYCTVCGAEISRETVTVDETGHTAGEAVIENYVAPTCTGKGSYDVVVYCTVCGAEISRETVTVDETGHTAGEAVTENYVTPTCTEEGSYDTVVYCTVCGAEISRETVTIPATDHTAGDPVTENYVAPTCTEEGSYDTVVYCTVCEAEISRETVTIPATGHTEGETVIENEVAATCTEEGSYDEVVYCTVCGEEISRTTVTVPATGHDYAATWTWTETEDGYTASVTITCANCDAEVTLEGLLIYVESETIAATCEEDGAIVYTATAAWDDETYMDTLTVVLAALGHDYDMDNPVWTWADDYSSATVSFICLNDPSHVYTVEATVTVDSTATDTDAGAETYTAVAVVDGVTYVAITTVGSSNNEDETTTEEQTTETETETTETVEEETTATSTDASSTGDSSAKTADISVGVWVLLMLVSGAGAACVGFFGRKKEDEA